MKFTTAVEDVAALLPPTGFAELARNVEPEWIADALKATGVSSLRRRKLPAEIVVWLVIAMALFRDRSILAVVTHLGLALDRESATGHGVVVPGAIPRARARVGDKPLEALFNQTATVWAHEAADRDRWRKLAVYAMDGTTVRIPDTAENEEHFGRPKSSRGPSAYPQVRLAALNVPRSHLLAGLALGSYTSSEGALAAQLWERVPDTSVVLLDRGFLAYGRLHSLQHSGNDRHWLIRAKSNTRMTVIRSNAPGDDVVQLRFSAPTRAEQPELPAFLEARAIRVERPGFRPTWLLTSLMDATAYPAAEVAALYRERWEIELGFDEAKTHMLERGESIRSKTPIGVLQELWGIGIGFNLVRLMMARAATARGLSPRRISFWNALLSIRNFSVMAWNDAVGALPRLLQALQRDLGLLLLPERRPRRSFPRTVKIKMSNYPRNTGRARHLAPPK